MNRKQNEVQYYTIYEKKKKSSTIIKYHDQERRKKENNNVIVTLSLSDIDRSYVSEKLRYNLSISIYDVGSVGLFVNLLMRSLSIEQAKITYSSFETI